MRKIKSLLLVVWSSLLFCMLYISRIWMYRDGYIVNGRKYSYNRSQRLLWVIPKWWKFVYPSAVTGWADAAMVDPIKKCVMVYPPSLELYEKTVKHEHNHLNYILLYGSYKFIFKYLWWLMRHGYRNNPIEVCGRLAEQDIQADIQDNTVIWECFCGRELSKIPSQTSVRCYFCSKIWIP